MFFQSQKSRVVLALFLTLMPLTAAQYLQKSGIKTSAEDYRSEVSPLPRPINPPPTFPAPPPPPPIYKKFDVVVYGDELQGICAAIWAKKTLGKNSKVVLVRSNAAETPLGGLLTRGGLAYLDYDKTPYWQYRPYSKCFMDFIKAARVRDACVESDRAAKAMKNMLSAAGVWVLSNAEVTPYIEKEKIKFAKVNGTNIRIKATAFIDATQDAELARKAGLSYDLGFEGQNRNLRQTTIAFSIVPTVEGLTISQFQRIENAILYNRKLMANIREDIKLNQSPVNVQFILQNFRKPIIKSYSDAYLSRSIALSAAYHLHRNIPFSYDSSFLFDKLNICRVGRRSLSLNGLLFKYPTDKIRDIERNEFKPTPEILAEMKALESWLQQMSGNKNVKLTIPPEVYVRHSLNIKDVVEPLTGSQIIRGGTARENSIGTFSYEFDFRGGVKGLGANYLPLPRFNFGIENALAKNVNNLAIVGRSSGYVGIAAAVGRIQTLNVYQGQAIGVAAGMAINSGMPLNKKTSAEVRQKLESLTGRKTRLKGRDKTGGRDYSKVK
ncbi:MAG: FAD-dependent oxidoreductase [Cyanobacteriota bacterium]|nr:FAD-dependent oxidoreductase [Cyanobacteriota bacterium]